MVHDMWCEDIDGDEIVKFIDGLITDTRYKDKIKWISIDGVADLLTNPNDIVESIKTAKKLRYWRKKANTHINTVIHNTKSSNSATGHLGSYVQKKSETVILLKDTNEDYRVKNSPIEVLQTYSRGAPFDPFFFKLNKDTLPFECENNSDEW
jgi:hypothetical protein